MTRIAASSRRGHPALFCLALAEALVVAPASGGYLVLVKALSHGTARIGPYHWWTPDVSWWHYHYYSPKAPLPAFLVLPLSLLLDGLGLQPGNPLGHVQSLEAGHGIDPLTVWPLTLVASTAAGFGLLVLVRNLAERVEPGYGTVAAVTVGAGTLLLPFSTLLFDHVLSALLAFAAFALLWRERRGEPNGRLVALGGMIAGLAIVAEYSAGLVAIVLGVYALSRAHSAGRAAAYLGGALFGFAPLLVYNAWAFGSPLHVSYTDAVLITGNSGHDHLGANGRGFFGIDVPSAHVALDLLFQHRGLLSISPVLALSAVGLVRMAKRGWRAEAIVIAAIFLSYFVYNTGYYLPFGGDSPGPRFLIATLPFLGVALAPAYRVAPWPTIVLALASTLMMLAATASPLLGNDDTVEWLRGIRHNHFNGTVLTHLVGWDGVAGFLPVLALVMAALVLGFRSVPRWSAGGQTDVAVFALLAWLLVMIYAAPLLRTGLGALAVFVLVSALVLTALRVAAGGLVHALPALLFVAVAAGLYRYPGWTLALSAVVAGAALWGRRPVSGARTLRESPRS